MSTHGIEDPFIDTTRFCIAQPTPLTDEQYEEIQKLCRAASNSQDAIFAGLRALSCYVCSAATEMEIDTSGLNDISWIVRHLTDELEAIANVQSGVQFSLENAYLHSQGKKRS